MHKGRSVYLQLPSYNKLAKAKGIEPRWYLQ